MPIFPFIFLFSAALLIYVIAGYPLLLLLFRRSAPPIRKAYVPRTVSMLIAVYNGEAFIRRKLESVLSLDYPRELMEVMVASDGSTDSTESIVEEFAPRGVRLLRVPRGGKAAALNVAIPQLTGEILVLTDVRQPLAPDCLRHLVACFSDPTVGAVSAELQILEGERHEEADMGLYWRYDVWIRKQMSRIGSTFGANGPCYAMRRELAAPLAPDMLLDDVMLPLGAFFRGYRLIIEPAAHAFDFPTGLGSEFRRKMRTLAGLWQVFYRVPALLSSANPMRFHFVSQKLGRLLIPYAIIGVTASAFGLPEPWRRLALWGLGLFYGLGLVDLVVPQQIPLKRITSPIRTFLVLSAATFCTIIVLFVPPQRLWKVTTVSRPKSNSTDEFGGLEHPVD
ncbi:MAG: glycosyltransferase family 2 protein [Bryobacteraceae bacterium]|jgi:cellulose synthase/poly-beta-1,6-N-acetylglucosamine synthase-like glycosyltransferase